MASPNSSSSNNDNQRIVRIAVCGCGEIATKAHLPAILRAPSDDDDVDDDGTNNESGVVFQLVALIDPKFDNAVGIQTFLATQQTLPPDIPCFPRLSDCLRSNTVVIDAVAICTPPSVTLDLAEKSLQAGKHVLIEKPPGDWRRLSKLKQDYLLFNENISPKSQPRTVLTAYHSAACVGFDHAQQWVQQHISNLSHVHFTWKENVRKWHPGQHWVTRKDPQNAQASCEGVLEMVFNPLSLLVALLGGSDWVVKSSHLIVPSNWETPISGSFAMERILENRRLITVTAEFAWDYEAPQDTKKNRDEIWKMVFTSNHQTESSATSQPLSIMTLTDGGSQVDIDGQRVTTRPTEAYALKPEYENLYRQFASLLQRQTYHVDDATPRLLQEIQEQAQYATGPPYEL